MDAELAHKAPDLSHCRFHGRRDRTREPLAEPVGVFGLAADDPHVVG
jgi:hypothetical protein